MDEVADYDTDTGGLGIRFGIPIAEKETITFGPTFEKTTLTLRGDAPDVYYKDAGRYTSECAAQVGVTPKTGCKSKTDNMRFDASWARDTRDSILYPTKGSLQKLSFEVGTPVGDLNYYKINYQYTWLTPLSRTVSLLLNGELGIGGGYSDKELPLFRNYFGGGMSTVRGFESGALGPKAVDSNGEIFSIGGDKRIVGNAELLFPMPGMGNDRSVRLSAFADLGAVVGPDDYRGRYKDLSDTDAWRYSAGLAVTWLSPMGPLKLSLAKPINAEDDETEEVFQFQFGSVF